MPLKFGNHKAIIFTGPSGGGKTTLSQYTLNHFGEVERSVSVTTRSPRDGEIHGIDYQFLSVIGAHSLKNYFKDNSIKIFVKTPSIEILEKRLLKRGTENTESVSHRLQKAIHELKEENNSDAVIINDILSDSQKDVYQLIHSYIYKES